MLLNFRATYRIGIGDNKVFDKATIIIGNQSTDAVFPHNCRKHEYDSMLRERRHSAANRQDRGDVLRQVVIPAHGQWLVTPLCADIFFSMRVCGFCADLTNSSKKNLEKIVVF
jgi:hypothetical protein